MSNAIPEGWHPLSHMPMGDHRFIEVEYLGPEGQTAQGYWSGQIYAKAPFRHEAHEKLGFEPIALRHLARAKATPFATREEHRFAQAIVDSDPVLRVFAACEWDELRDDGKEWTAVIIREALKTVAFTDALAAIDRRLDDLQEIKGDGFWRSCSGCHETCDGYQVGQYPYNAAMKCHLGSGCHECGGIGAVWDDTDYADMAEFMMAADRDHENVKRVLIEKGGLQPYAAEQLTYEITALDAKSEAVMGLVIAAREAWEQNGASGDDLDKALEKFASTVPFENEPVEVQSAADQPDIMHDADCLSFFIAHPGPCDCSASRDA